MRLSWVGYNVKWHDGQPTSSAASARYRMLIPAEALKARGHEVKLLQLTLDDDLDKVAAAATGDALVISKLSPNAEIFERTARTVIELIRRVRANGTRVLIDVSDDHFSDPLRGPYYVKAMNECDGVVASTPSLAEIARRHAARPVRVVGDPYEGSRRPSRFEPPKRPPSGLLAQVLKSLLSGRGRPLRLLWFGHESNFEVLVALVPQLRALSGRYAIDLHVVTSPHPEIVGLCERLDRDNAPALTLRFSAWSVEATWQALEDCDLVIIPAQFDDRSKAVKSPNRVIESIWAGRFVCASPVPSYREFSEFAWIDEDIVSGIEWAIRNPQEAARRLDAGQTFIAGRYAPEAIAREWEAVLVQSGRDEAPLRSDTGVRLNLGCGDKILSGYVNVDVAESRDGIRPDVLCDLHRLYPFADDSADEVLSVHVVEHFWRWEVAEVLKEWVRVLKPGGTMILECPNLISACEAFLRDPDGVSGPGPEGKTTMWVFYGDPVWRDPLMVHRWGYTPQSLARLMSEAGLVNVRQEPAQFKRREPRDMRIVGEKPV